MALFVQSSGIEREGVCPKFLSSCRSTNARLFKVLLQYEGQQQMAAMTLTPSSSSSMSISPSAATAKEALLLTHAESHDDWAGWCTVESEPVPCPLFPPADRIGNIQPIALGHWSLTSTNP